MLIAYLKIFRGFPIIHSRRTRQEYGMVGSYMEYGFPGEREGETTVQVEQTEKIFGVCPEQKSEPNKTYSRWNILVQPIYKDWPLRPQ